VVLSFRPNVASVTVYGPYTRYYTPSDTLFVMEPLIEGIRMMLPLFPNRTICLPAACTVNNTPFVLTLIT
jgi:hypothetical protein